MFFGPNGLETEQQIYSDVGLATAGDLNVTGVANIDSQLNAVDVNITGNLDVGSIVSSGNANIAITAAGTGVINLNRSRLETYREVVHNFGNATGTITPNINNGSIQTMTLTGNITFNTINNITAGSSATFVLIQDATGGRTLTSNMLFAGNIRTLSTAANSRDIVSVFFDGSTYYAALSRGYV
jgi:hypothetical protein